MYCSRSFHRSLTCRAFVLSAFAIAAVAIFPSAAPVFAAAPPENPGVEIFQPVPSSDAKPEEVAFADGCGSYLSFYVSGQPEFGQTMPRIGTRRAAYELKLPRALRLSLPDAVRLAQITGGTVVGTGSVQAGHTAGTLTLTYTLYDVATQKPLGAPVSATGSPASITAALPHVVEGLCRQLGAATPFLPTAGSISAAQLAAAGHITTDEDALKAFEPVLRPAAKTDAFAAALAIQFPGNEADKTALAQHLGAKLAAWNTLAWCTIASTLPAVLAADTNAAKARSERHPKSAALAYVELRAASLAKDSIRVNAAQARLLADAPLSPDAYTTVGGMMLDEASMIRQDRFTTQMTKEELSQIQARYQQWENDEKQAVAIDPNHAFAYLQWAMAAAYLHDRSTFDTAFEKAKTYTADKYSLYLNGIFFSEPQWGASHEELARMAKAASQCRDYDSRDYVGREGVVQIAALLRSYNFVPESAALLPPYRKKFEAAAKESPDNSYIALQFARLLIFTGDAEEGIPQVLKLISQTKDDNLLWDCTEALSHSGHSKDSIPTYRKLAADGWKLEELYFHMSNALNSISSYDEALKYAELGMKTAIYSARIQLERGVALYHLRRYSDAWNDFQTLSGSVMTGPELVGYGTMAAASLNKTTEADAWAKACVDRYGDDGSKTGYSADDYAFVHYALANYHLASKREPDALYQIYLAIKLNPHGGFFYRLRGDIYETQGKRTEAREEWSKALTTLVYPSDRAPIEKRLADSPPRPVTPIVETSEKKAQLWKWTIARPTGDDWTKPGFDTSGWSDGKGGFGSPGAPFSIGTNWTTPDIWIRRSVTLPRVFKAENVRITAFHDDGAEFYINGIPAAHVSGYISDYLYSEIAPDALAQLKPGATVTLAAHCHQEWGGQGIDFGLVSLEGP